MVCLSIPKINQGAVTAHFVRLSINAQIRLHQSVKADGSDDHLFKIDTNQFRLFRPETDPAPIHGDAPVQEEAPRTKDQISEQFTYENKLRDYLARNLHVIELDLTLNTGEDINGVEKSCRWSLY